MRRWLLKLGLLLAAGAIVNVAVAWGCALLLNPFDWPQGPFGTDATKDKYDHWSCYANAIQGAEAHMYSPASVLDLDEALGIDQQSRTLAQWRAPWEASEELDDSCQTLFDARGWPRPCLWSKITLGATGLQSSHGIRTRSAVIMRQNQIKIPRFLPLRPLWPGFAINTLLYAALVWIAFFAPFCLCRWRRIRRGLCPACAYPVGASDVCTECGRPVKG